MSPSRKGFPKLQSDFGKRVRFLREARDFTREELAAAASLSPQNLAKIESGERFVGAQSLANLASALRTTPSDLFHFESAASSKSGAKKKLDTLIGSAPETAVTLIYDLTVRILKDF